MLLLGMIVLGLATFVAMLAFVTLCDGCGTAMNELSLLLSVGAFVYLVYAMLRPEKLLRPPWLPNTPPSS